MTVIKASPKKNILPAMNCKIGIKAIKDKYINGTGKNIICFFLIKTILNANNANNVRKSLCAVSQGI